MKNPSKLSAAPSRASGHEPPAAAWPIPQPGDVISYSYLWSYEARTGRIEGVKDRPVAVVVAVATAEGGTRIIVAPITHSEPRRMQNAIELPNAVKRDLGLDHERSWVILSETNHFIWPGPDIRVVGGASDPYYGAIPDILFLKVRDAIVALNKGGRLRMIKRTE